MISYKYKLYKSKKTTALEHMMREAAFVWNHSLALQKRYHSLAVRFGWERTYIDVVRMQKHFAKRVARTRLDAQRYRNFSSVRTLRSGCFSST